jgi:hypothetical protein
MALVIRYRCHACGGRSFPELTDTERAALLERVGELKGFEGLSDDGRARLAETRARLLGT